MLDVAELALRASPDKVEHGLKVEIGRAMSKLGFRRVPRSGGSRGCAYEAAEELLSAPRREPRPRSGLALVAASK